MGRLNVQSVFSSLISFNSCDLLFCFPADRASSYFSLTCFFKTIVRMSVFTNGFLTVNVSYRPTVFHRILGSRYRLKVLWVYARSIAAGVINNISLLNFSMSRKPRYSVSLSVCATKKHGPVSVFIKISAPHKAIANFFKFTFKMLKLTFGKVFHECFVANEQDGVKGCLCLGN